MKNYCIALAVLLNLNCYAQKKEKFNPFKKGQAFGYWGWNRAFYTKSNIRFHGSDYNFELFRVKAHDRPTLPVSFDNYILNPFTPQNNYRLGYFLSNNLAVSLGVDHMKYVMDQDQEVMMKGSITRDGFYLGEHNGYQKLTRDFLTFEHTNGLNYVNLELEKYYPFYHSISNKLVVAGVVGLQTGILYPKSDIRLMDYKENDQFHLAGYGISAKLGIAAVFLKYFVLRFESKDGYINMPDIILHEKGIPGRAKQNFFFEELDGSLGFTVDLSGKHA